MDTTFLLNSILKSDGTNQDQRMLPALDPDFIKVDDRGIKELLSFTYELANQIIFFNTDNTPDGDWTDFFNPDPFTDYDSLSSEDIVNILNTKSDFSPHFALFLAFVKLFRFAQDDINTITKSHLDFYFTKVLQLQPKAAIPDKVHLILELAKNLADHKIDANTPFKALKDKTGVPIYATDNEIVINKAQVNSVKSVYIDMDENDMLGIYAATAANSVDGKGKPSKDSNFKWSGFGEDQKNKSDDERNMELASIGFAFASPMLLLAEGDRVITLTIQFSNVAQEEVGALGIDISQGLELWLSGEKAWIAPSQFTARFNKTPLPPDPLTNAIFYACQLVITISLASVDPAVVPFNNAVLGGSFSTEWPVLKVLLVKGAYLYNNLYNLQVQSGTIDVSVNGVKNLVLQNNQSQLNAGKPFQPFGPAPAIGSAFYIGSAEVFQKKLTSLSLDVLWNEVPAANMGNYYNGYITGDATGTVLSNLSFTANISLLYMNQWRTFRSVADPLSSKDYYLFHPAIASQANTIPITEAEWSLALQGVNYSRNTGLQEIDSFDNQTHDGFIKLEISGPVTPFKAFGYIEYPGLYAKAAIAMATKDPSFSGLPNAPYTPSIKSLALNYHSSQEIDLTDQDNPEQFFCIEPFGCRPLDTGSPYLLPQYRNETNLPQPKSESQLYLGNFYLGIENLVPPQNLSMLFQVAEGSADVNTIIEDEDISWSYLANNKWIPITALQVITNTTNAFQTSGIISLAIGGDASNNNTLMPAGVYWLRASVTKNPAGISSFIDVKTQAVEASYVLPADAGMADLHLSKPMPALSIKELVVKDAAVKSVSQPYESFYGNASEKDTVFYTRVSERLRHKKRALTLWDYERLILDAFPEIFKVKCLTHTNDTSDFAAGTVSAVVVPNLINKNSVNPLQPKTNLVTLQNIEAYMSQYLPLFVTFKVGNPVYEQLLVDFKVGFRPGMDAGYYGNLLNEEIKRFLSPWAYEEGQDITFGGKVFKSDIIVFIENRPYVDFVNNFNLYHIFDGTDDDGKGIGRMAIGKDFIISEPFFPAIGDMAIGVDFVVGRDTEVAIASGPRSILVSAPNHRITVLKTGEYMCEGVEYLGIGFMAIDENFTVN